MCTNPHSKGSLLTCVGLYRFTTKRCTATHCITLQHTATHCNALHHTASHCNALQHTASHCNELQHTVPLQHTATHCTTLHHTATHCNTLQHTATHCTTLQHTATRSMTRQSVSLFSLLMDADGPSAPGQSSLSCPGTYCDDSRGESRYTSCAGRGVMVDLICEGNHFTPHALARRVMVDLICWRSDGRCHL